MSIRPQRVEHRRRHRLDRRRVGDVDLDRDRLAPRPAELAGDGLGGGQVEVGDGHPRALEREYLGDPAPDAARGAGDDGDPFVQRLQAPPTPAVSAP